MFKNITNIIFMIVLPIIFLSACQTSKSRNRKVRTVLAQEASFGKTSTKQLKDNNSFFSKFSKKEEKQIKSVVISSDNQVRVGLLLPLSGNAKKVGQALKEAALMAQYEIADNSFLMQFYDTKGTPQGAEKAAQEALDQGVKLIIGPVFSNSVKAISLKARRKNVNVIAFTTDPNAIEKGVYTIGLLVRQQVERIVSYAYVNGISRFAVVVPDNPSGRAVVDGLMAVTQRLDANVTKIGFYNENGSDISKVISELADYKKRQKALEDEKLKLENLDDEISKEAYKKLEQLDTLGNVDFDAILIPAEGTRLRSVASMLAYYDVFPSQIKFLGTSLWDNPSTRKESSLRGGWYPALPKEGNQEFVRRFKEIYGYKPPRIASLAYDAVALASVVAKDNSENVFNSDALTNDSGFIGVDGIFRLHKNGYSERGLSVMSVSRRKVKEISKAPDSFDENRYEFYNEPIPYKAPYNSQYGNWSLFESPNYGEEKPKDEQILYSTPSIIEKAPFGEKAEWIEKEALINKEEENKQVSSPEEKASQDTVIISSETQEQNQQLDEVEKQELGRSKGLDNEKQEKEQNSYFSNQNYEPIEEEFVITR